MTEAEAKTKWCPFARSAPPAFGAVAMPGSMAAQLGGALPRENFQCVGSVCMAWRWLPDNEQTRGQSYAHPDESDPPPLGFCGLACKP